MSYSLSEKGLNYFLLYIATLSWYTFWKVFQALSERDDLGGFYHDQRYSYLCINSVILIWNLNKIMDAATVGWSFKFITPINFYCQNNWVNMVFEFDYISLKSKCTPFDYFFQDCLEVYWNFGKGRCSGRLWCTCTSLSIFSPCSKYCYSTYIVIFEMPKYIPSHLHQLI